MAFYKIDDLICQFWLKLTKKLSLFIFPASFAMMTLSTEVQKLKTFTSQIFLPENKACTMYMYQFLAQTKSVQTLKIIRE